MNFLENQEGFLRGREFLKKQLIKKGYDWDVERMVLTDGEMYANAKISIGGTVPLLTGNSTEVRGVTNFNGNKLVKNRVFVVESVAFGFVVDDRTKKEHEVDYKFNEVSAELKFANLVLKQSDEKIISLPIAGIINGQKDNKYRDLGALALIEDDVITDLEIEFPHNVTSSLPIGQKLFVSVFFKGFETRIKR